MSNLIQNSKWFVAVKEFVQQASIFSTIKRILNGFGIILGILGVIFVIQRLFLYSGQVDFLRFTGYKLLILIGLTCLFAIANLLYVFSWQKILLFLDLRINFRNAFIIYGRSILAKYVPGNIFQFAGRQAIGVSMELPGKPLALSIIWELGLLASTGVTFFFLSLPLITNQVSFTQSLVFFILAIFTLVVMAKVLFGNPISQAIIYYILFLSFTGIVFVVIITNTTVLPGANTTKILINMCGAFVVAWLIGFITPGAPGGLGVREMVLYFFLNTYIRQSDLMMIIVISRMISIVGDSLFSLISFLLKQ
jgi:glycosyltransferase 2 family protein